MGFPLLGHRRAERCEVCDNFASGTAGKFLAGSAIQVENLMAQKILLVVPEAPSSASTALVDERHIGKQGIRLGVLDNSKGNADHLLRFIVEAVKASVPVSSVVSLRKGSVSLPAPRFRRCSARKTSSSQSSAAPASTRRISRPSARRNP